MASEFDDHCWELSKENVRPLPGGRSVAAINAAIINQETADGAEQLRRQQIAFETEIRLYSGEDPLDVWDRYVNWTVQMFPQEGKGSCLSELLEQVIDRFKDEAVYHNDLRFVGHCLKFASSLQEPIELYSYMYSVGIGKKLAIFYSAWAAEYEMQENFKKASDVIMNGLQQNAQPVEKLVGYQRQLDLCLARKMITRISEVEGQPEETTNQEEQRMAFASLKVVGKKAQAPVKRVGNAVTGPPGVIPMQPRTGHQQQCKQTFIPLDENKLVMPPEVTDQQPWVAPPACTAQENELKPQPWNKIRYKKYPSSGLHNPAPSRPSFVPYVEEPGPNPHSSMPTQRKIDLLTSNVLSARKADKSEGFLERIQNHHDANDKTKVTYCKEKLNAGLQDFSFEELRAERHKQKIHQGQMICQQEKEAKEKMAKMEEEEEEKIRLDMESLQMMQKEKCEVALQATLKAQNELEKMQNVQSQPPNACRPAFSQKICTQDEKLCPQEPPLPQNPDLVPSLQENVQPIVPYGVLSHKLPMTAHKTLSLSQPSESITSPLYKRWCSTSVQPVKPLKDKTTFTEAPDLDNRYEIKTLNENRFPWTGYTESLAMNENPNSSVLQRNPEANASAMTPKELSVGPSSSFTSPSPYRQQDPTFNTKEALGFIMPMFSGTPVVNDEEDVYGNPESMNFRALFNKLADEPSNAVGKNPFQIFEESLMNRSQAKKTVDEPSSSEYIREAADHDKNDGQKSADLDGFEPITWNTTTDAMGPTNQTFGWIPDNTRQFAQLAPLVSTPFSVHQDKYSDEDENSKDKVMMKRDMESFKGRSCFMETYISSQKQLSPIDEMSNEITPSSASSCGSVTSLKTTLHTENLDLQATSSIPAQSNAIKSSLKPVPKPETMVATLSSQSCLDNDIFISSSVPAAPRSTKSECQSNFQDSVLDENEENRPIPFKEDLLKEQQPIESGHIVEKPWNPYLIQSLLSQLTPPLDSLPNFFRSNTCIPKINLKSKLQLGNTTYHVQAFVGDGAFAKVYCSVATKPDGSNENVALKVQMPPHPWEFYICTQLNTRLSPANLALFINMNSGHIYNNGSILVGELHSRGSLLDVANWLRQQAGNITQETLLLYIATSMLYTVEQLHKANIIHTDIKPDNFVINNRNGEWSYNIEDCHPSRLVLIDFGQSIDLNLFPPGTVFKGSSETSAFQCIEMLTDQPWKFQPDYFGIASSMHCLIFGKYMEVYQNGDVWKMKSTLKRWHLPVWNHFFSTLLNARDCHSTNILVDLRTHLLQFMKNDARSFQSSLKSIWKNFFVYLDAKLTHKK